MRQHAKLKKKLSHVLAGLLLKFSTIMNSLLSPLVGSDIPCSNATSVMTIAPPLF
jgi:hypothetical protein